VAEIEAKKNADGKGFKLTLKNFVEGATIPSQMEEID